MKKLRYLNHSEIDVYFKQSKEDFTVDEIPLYEFTGDGEHLILRIRKKDLSTWDMVEILSNQIGCKSRDIGYAGLKDKNAMTIQYISLPRKFEEQVEQFVHPQIKVLEKMYHNNKIKTGHLKGNKFFIRLKRVQDVHKMKLESALEQIVNYGMPNYFGFQRFGIDGDNYIKGKEIIEGHKKERNRKLRQMYINAYQSHLFNEWLSKRIEISKIIDNFKANEISDRLGLDEKTIKQIQKQPHPLKLLKGDLMSHYPFGRIFYVEDMESESTKFYQRDRVPTGLLSGKKAKHAQDDALKFEEEFIHETHEHGSRRFAWIFPENISSNYKEEKAWFELSFELPKGSYATELIAELLHN